MAPRWAAVRDGAGRHGSRALRIPDIITLLPGPPHDPEPNPIAAVRACFRARRRTIPVLEPHGESVARCYDAWAVFAGTTGAITSITTRDDSIDIKS